MYETELHNSLILRLDICTALIYSSGNIIITKCTSVNSYNDAVVKITDIINVFK